jgi:hypothetical protein
MVLFGSVSLAPKNGLNADMTVPQLCVTSGSNRAAEFSGSVPRCAARRSSQPASGLDHHAVLAQQPLRAQRNSDYALRCGEPTPRLRTRCRIAQ